ncbi:MAG: hypothetical protein EHM28_00555 [Spirochaetaceae bacterium]|nr:MAG: hypothetical protein EHM28_00555 [Spirochaetaceae bacterium]
MKSKRIGLVLQVIFLAFFSGCDENTATVPGRVDAFDPVACLDAVATYAGKDVLLVELYAKYVRPDGTLNLQAEYKPDVRYRFFGTGKPANATPEPKKPDLPLGVPRMDAPREVIPYWEYTSVYIENPHWEEYTINGDDAQKWHGGMTQVFGGKTEDYAEIEKLRAVCSALPPVLSFGIIWKRAIEAGAPSGDVVANIEYKAGVYRFYIDGTKYEYYFDEDGRLIRDNDQSAGKG